MNGLTMFSRRAARPEARLLLRWRRTVKVANAARATTMIGRTIVDASNKGWMGGCEEADAEDGDAAPVAKGLFTLLVVAGVVVLQSSESSRKVLSLHTHAGELR